MRSELGKRRVNSTISLSLDAWTALDLMAEEDDRSPSDVMQRLIVAEAKRRMEAKALPQVQAAPPEKPKARRNISDAERQRRREHMQRVNAERLALVRGA